MKTNRRAEANWKRAGVALALAVAMMTGCASQQDKAIEAAKKQAAASGQAQQVVTVDKAGNTTTTTIQPPAPGQTAEAISTTTAPRRPRHRVARYRLLRGRTISRPERCRQLQEGRQ